MSTTAKKRKPQTTDKQCSKSDALEMLRRHHEQLHAKIRRSRLSWPEFAELAEWVSLLSRRCRAGVRTRLVCQYARLVAMHCLLADPQYVTKVTMAKRGREVAFEERWEKVEPTGRDALLDSSICEELIALVAPLREGATGPIPADTADNLERIAKELRQMNIERNPLSIAVVSGLPPAIQPTWSRAMKLSTIADKLGLSKAMRRRTVEPRLKSIGSELAASGNLYRVRLDTMHAAERKRFE